MSFQFPRGQWVKKIESPIQINKLQHLIDNQLTHPSKAILDNIKGNGGPQSVNVTSQWLSGVPDYFGRNKISSGGDLSHYSSASLY